MEINEMNLYQKLLAITAGLNTVAKNLNVETGKGKSYKAVSERDVLDAVKPLEEKYHVYSYPYNRTIIDKDTLVTTTQYGERTQFFMRMETVYRFVNADKPEEFIDIQGFGDGIDSGDKAPGKAMTYSDKYALLKAYKISTGDDPDQEASKEYKVDSGKILADLLGYDNKLAAVGVDRHADAVVRFVAAKVKKPELTTLDPTVLVDTDVKLAKAVMKTYDAIIKAKEDEKAQRGLYDKTETF